MSEEKVNDEKIIQCPHCDKYIIMIKLTEYYKMLIGIINIKMMGIYQNGQTILVISTKIKDFMLIG